MELNFKRLAAGAVACAMALSLAACTNADNQQANNDPENGVIAGGTVFSEPTTVEMLVASHISWPYNENWAIWNIIEKKTGADLDITAIPSTDVATKIPLMMSNPDELPDLMYLINGTKGFQDEYGPVGALVPINQYEKLMPNYTAFWNEKENKDAEMLARTSGDGNVYMAPLYGTDDFSGSTWMYRKDIFEQHGLKIPTTYDELYDVCKKLKELYPESYPLCLRSGIHVLDQTGQAWREYMCYHPNYNYDTGKWEFGVVMPEFKEMIAFYRKMIEEKLLPPDFFTISTKTWEGLMSTDRGFITYDYIIRIDQFNKDVGAMDENFEMDSMAPPVATEKGVAKVLKKFPELNGFSVINSGDETKIENAIKLVDWFFSPEGVEVQSWGEEGITYEVVDGKRKWLTAEDADISNTFGLFTPGAYVCVDPEAYNYQYSDRMREISEECKNYATNNPSPFFTMAFPNEVAAERADIWVALNGLCAENLSKFLLGQRPMEEWEDFVSELNGLGVDRVLEIYDQTFAAYNK